MAQIVSGQNQELVSATSERDQTLASRIVERFRSHKELVLTLAIAAIAVSVIATAAAENQQNQDPQDTGVSSNN